jgi:hypothetical protein
MPTDITPDATTPYHAHNDHHFHRGHRVFVGGYGFYDGYYGYYDDCGCGWLNRNAVATGSPYWWNRYQYCVGNYD